MAKHPPLPKRYSRAPVMGAIFGLVLVVAPLCFGTNILMFFISLGGLIIVVGGVIAVAFMSYEGEQVHISLSAIKSMFHEPRVSHEELRDDMASILEWSAAIKQRGTMAFESKIS